MWLAALAGSLLGCAGDQGESAATTVSGSGDTSGLTGGSSTLASSTSATTAAGTTATGTTATGTTAAGTSSSGDTSIGSSSGATVGAGAATNVGVNSTVAGSSPSSTASNTGGTDGTGSTGSAGQGGSSTDTTSSQTSGGGTGGSSSYQPCPTNGDPCIVLPFGDSITDGVGSTDLAGYRTRLFELVVQANQKITFVGSRSSGPDQISGQQFPRNHEGHPGWTIDSGYVSFGDGISTLVPDPAFSTLPHIVLLMIGTNDADAAQGKDTIADRLETLLDDVVATAPDALIVVAVPTPISWNPASLQTYSQRIPEIVEERAAQGEHMVMADMSQMPANGLASDGIHPNDQGYVYMATVWYAAIEGVLPQ